MGSRESLRAVHRPTCLRQKLLTPFTTAPQRKTRCLYAIPARTPSSHLIPATAPPDPARTLALLHPYSKGQRLRHIEPCAARSRAPLPAPPRSISVSGVRATSAAKMEANMRSTSHRTRLQHPTFSRAPQNRSDSPDARPPTSPFAAAPASTGDRPPTPPRSSPPARPRESRACEPRSP